jgi:hypothetical protein
MPLLGNIASQATVTNMKNGAVTSGPAGLTDGVKGANYVWDDATGVNEWVALTFPTPRTVGKVVLNSSDAYPVHGAQLVVDGVVKATTTATIGNTTYPEWVIDLTASPVTGKEFKLIRTSNAYDQVYSEIEIWETNPINNKYLFQDGTDIKKYVSGKLIPDMTSNMLPSPFVASSSSIYSNYDAWNAFDGRTDTEWIANNSSGWLQIDLGAGNEKAIKSYSITGYSVGAWSPNSWRFEGSNDGVIYSTLDLQSGQGSLIKSQIRKTYSFTNSVKYRYYRLNIIANSDSTSAKVAVALLELSSDQNSYQEKTWSTIGAAPVTKAMFDTDGMTDLSIVDNTAIQALVSATPEVLCWTDDAGAPSSTYTDNLIPAMTSATAPSGNVIDNTNWYGGSPWKLFDGITAASGSGLSTSIGFYGQNGWVGYHFSSSQIITKYVIFPNGMIGTYGTPTDWTFQGSNDGTTWTTLDTRTNVGSWTTGTGKEFTFPNTTSYAYYRLYITKNDANGAQDTYISELQMMGSVMLPPSRTLNTTAVPNNKLLLPTSDLTVGEVDSLALKSTLSGSADLKVLVSVDSGGSWKGNGGVVNPANLSAVKANGYTPVQLNALVNADWKSLGVNGKLRLAFYLEQAASTDTCSVDQLNINEKVYTLSPSVSSLSVLFNLLQASQAQYFVSRDDGVTWKEIQPDQLTKLDDLPSGKALRVKAVLKDGQELYGLSYSWI